MNTWSFMFLLLASVSAVVAAFFLCRYLKSKKKQGAGSGGKTDPLIAKVHIKAKRPQNSGTRTKAKKDVLDRVAKVVAIIASIVSILSTAVALIATYCIAPIHPIELAISYDMDSMIVSGIVAGGKSNDYDQYRAILFISTNDSDIWYIKPEYSRDKDGYMIPLNDNGWFDIRAYRKYPQESSAEVTKIAVFLVPADYEGPARQSDYEGVKSVSIAFKTLQV